MPKNAKQLIRELIDDVIEEMTTSASAGPYLTKAAFRGHKSKDAVALRSIPGGKVVGKEVTDDTTVGEAKEFPEVQRSLEEGRYRNFKKDESMRSHTKVCYGIAEAKKMLREVEFLMDIVERLKTEEGVDKSQLWKRTRHDLSEINKRTKAIARRVYRLGKR
jgi:hypothetical protein